MVEPKIKGFSHSLNHIYNCSDHSHGIWQLYHSWEPLMWLTTSKAFYYESREKKSNIAQVEALQVLELINYRL